MTTRRASAALFVILAITAAGGGCAVIASPITASDTVERTLAVPAGTSVRVEAFNGSIEVAGEAGSTSVSARVRRTGAGDSTADAEADRERIAVTLELVDGVAVLRAVYTPDPSSPSNRGASANVTVPSGTSVELATSNGRITVVDTGGAVDARTSNGSVDLSGVTGAIAVETSNGEVGITATDATADVRTSNARLAFTGSLAAGSHAFRTSNGAVELTLPPDAAFMIDARTSNAEIRSDFPISVDDGEASGSVGDPGLAAAVSIRVDTSNASIAIRRR